MELWRIGLFSLIAYSVSGEQIIRGKELEEKYNVVINEAVESHLRNVTDDIVSHSNSFESELLDTCEPNPCKNNGVCVLSSKEISCICEEQFRGSRCELSLCDPNPCENNGRCEINEEEFECNCEESFAGKLCENVLELCEENPCKNGGLCRKENGQLKCACIGPYAGEYCEIDCDCGDAVCELYANGTQKKCNCTEKQILYESKCVDCDCGDAFCELDVNGTQKECNCTEKQILFKGKCVDCDCGNGSCKLDYRGDKICKCHKNQALYKGKCEECDCGERSSKCYFDYRGRKQCVCLPGYAPLKGSCSACSCGKNSTSCLFNEKGKVVCYCQKGFSPRNNTCHETCISTRDCFNKGMCTTEKEGKFCKCRSGYSGDKCQIDDICESMPLKDKCMRMGADCIREGTTRGKCVCPVGKYYWWITGKCEDVCKTDTCIHGTCAVVGNDYRCICNKGYKGDRCNEIVKTEKDKPGSVSVEVIVVPVILGIVIVVLIIGTICLIHRNRKLRNNSGQRQTGVPLT